MAEEKEKTIEKGQQPQLRVPASGQELSEADLGKIARSVCPNSGGLSTIEQICRTED